MNILFSDRLGDKFGVLFLTGLVVIKRVNEFLVWSTILNLVDSAIERIVLDTDQGLLSESISINYFE
jgi:hypothetical protein